MKLTVNKELIQMPVDATISIERRSPALNDDTGTFSYPFPVPTLPNQKPLGYPGRLQRVGYLSNKSFVLEEQGLQIIRGEVEFDSITKAETGLVLISGLSEFFSKVKKKYLTDLDLGNTAIWSETTSQTQLQGILDGWDSENTLDVSHRVFAPVVWEAPGIDGGLWVGRMNRHNTSTDKLLLNIPLIGSEYRGGHGFMIQFRIWWVMKAIFESQGYTVEQNDLETTDLKKLVMLTNAFSFYVVGSALSSLTVTNGTFGTLEYATLMPEKILVTDFIDAVKGLTCCMVDIDERRKVVRFALKKDIFLPANLDGRNIPELDSWDHTEERQKDGFALRYQNQFNELDTEEDYEISQTVQTTLPTPTTEDEVVHITDYDRDYVTVMNDANELEWRRIGRLKGYVVDGGEEETTIDVNIPQQSEIDGAEGPTIYFSEVFEWPSGPKKIPGLYMSLYHGRKDFNGFNCPYTCPEKYSLATSGLPYSVVTNSTSLEPEALHDLVYADFLIWSAEKRIMTKYLRLSLRDVINLQWNKRYVVNGIPILLNKINFELPHKGICKIEAYTAPARDEVIDFGPLPPNLIM